MPLLAQFAVPPTHHTPDPMPPRRHQMLKQALRTALRTHLHKGEEHTYRIEVADLEIRITWDGPAALPAVQQQSMAEELLGTVQLRSRVQGTKDSIRNNVERPVPWVDSNEVWQTLGQEVPIQCSGTVPGAFVPLQRRLQQLVAVTPREKWHMWGSYLVCRLGIDNTTRWAKPIEVVAVSITGRHSCNDWEALGVFFTKETKQALADLLAETPWDTEIPNLTVTAPDGSLVKVRCCISCVVGADLPVLRPHGPRGPWKLRPPKLQKGAPQDVHLLRRDP